MNFNKDADESTNNNLKYFQSRIPEEDNPIEFSDELQDNYQKLEFLYESFFDSNFLTLAKVFINLSSNLLKKKEMSKNLTIAPMFMEKSYIFIYVDLPFNGIYF